MLSEAATPVFSTLTDTLSFYSSTTFLRASTCIFWVWSKNVFVFLSQCPLKLWLDCPAHSLPQTKGWAALGGGLLAWRAPPCWSPSPSLSPSPSPKVHLSSGFTYVAPWRPVCSFCSRGRCPLPGCLRPWSLAAVRSPVPSCDSDLFHHQSWVNLLVVAHCNEFRGSSLILVFLFFFTTKSYWETQNIKDVKLRGRFECWRWSLYLAPPLTHNAPSKRPWTHPLKWGVLASTLVRQPSVSFPFFLLSSFPPLPPSPFFLSFVHKAPLLI